MIMVGFVPVVAPGDEYIPTDVTQVRSVYDHNHSHPVASDQYEIGKRTNDQLKFIKVTPRAYHIFVTNVYIQL